MARINVVRLYVLVQYVLYLVGYREQEQNYLSKLVTIMRIMPCVPDYYSIDNLKENMMVSHYRHLEIQNKSSNCQQIFSMSTISADHVYIINCLLFHTTDNCANSRKDVKGYLERDVK